MENKNQIVLEVSNLSVDYSGKPAVSNVNFKLPEGSITGVIGPNGSGKTTMLKAIMGLVPLSSGKVKIFGEDLSKVRNRISYIPQRGTVDWDFPVSVRDVVMMGRYGQLGLFKNPTKEDRQIVEEAIEKMGISEFSKRQISQLSGGQQQRVFLARALAQKADFYLMDEPFVGVDMATEEAIIKLMRHMASQGKSVMVVHHDLFTAREYFDKIVMLNTKLVAVGRTEEVITEKNLAVVYGGRLNLFAKVQ